ncbi:MAG: NADH-quinone oxidoreductase subunit NuoG [Syntrophobacteraceae bacterium]
MPRLVIDDLEIEVPPGTKVIDAAERLGIMIPRFCYHEALGSVGACRMCAVKFIHGPVKGIQMSCMIDARDGMVVSTTDEEAVAFRKQVIEWLMLNHPHDCPVCDEGGQCLLQDETVSGGHGVRRYLGKKRTYRDQYLGPFIKHEMNRCIHCYRCSRYYQEFTGYRDLGPLQIGNRLYFGRFSDGALESPFSGNLVDICPTGVYTDKPARFKVRRWDLQRSPSLCIHCSLGCNTIGNAHYRAIMRVEGRLNQLVNGFFICDVGRFGFSYTNGGTDYKQRPRISRIDGAETTPEAAAEESARRLAEISRTAGPEAIAAVGSARNSLETQCMLKRICRGKGWRGPAFFTDPAISLKVRSAVERLDKGIAVSMREIEIADFVIVVGADPLNEAPMAAVAIRQASRRNAPVVVIDPRPVSLPLDFIHVPAPPDGIEKCFGALVKGSISKEEQKTLGDAAKGFCKALPAKFGDPEARTTIPELAAKLRASRRPVIVCGTGVVRESTPAFAADCALLLREAGKQAGIFYVLPGASSFSSALLSGPDGGDFSGILEGIEQGSVRALVALESDPLRDFPDRERLDLALSKLDLLIAIDYLPTDTVERAAIFHPASTLYETGSTFVNQEGRVQFAERVHRGGEPIWGAHPPRVFRDFVPGCDHRPAREILWKISGETSPLESVLTSAELIAAEIPAFETIGEAKYPVDQARIIPEKSEGGFVKVKAGEKKGAKPRGLELLLVDRMFASGELAAYSDTLRSVVPEPLVFMHALDAAGAGLSDGDMVSIELDGGIVEMKLSLSDRMAEGVLVMPRHNDVDWRKLKAFPAWVPVERIKKM